MKREDIIIEAFDLIKGEVEAAETFTDVEYIKGVIDMTIAVTSMIKENE